MTILGLPAWVQARNVDAVSWTALPHSCDKDKPDRIVSSDVVVAYLCGLTGRLRHSAERYIRNAPPQIDTPYRRAIGAKLGWTGRNNG